MAACRTPCSKLQNSPTSEVNTRSPSTPQLPFAPPRRRSSLGFSKVMDSPSELESQQGEHATQKDARKESVSPDLDPGGGKPIKAPFRYSAPSPGHVAQVQKVLQLAQASLNLDIRYAASPEGSIDSRLPQPDLNANPKQQAYIGLRRSEKTWRYSVIPQLFSATKSDVREPFPDASPELPALAMQEPADDDGDIPLEPTSSGFASPFSTADQDSDEALGLPPLPCSGSSDEEQQAVPDHDSYDTLITNADDVSDLTQPMTGLKVGSGLIMSDKELMDDVEESPIIDHLRRKSGCTRNPVTKVSYPPDSIFLSQSARAAAESAKAKRVMLKQAVDHRATGNNVDVTSEPSVPTVLHRASIKCPDPHLHQFLAATPCPNPLAHVQLSSPGRFLGHQDTPQTRPFAPGNSYDTSFDVPMRTDHMLYPKRRTTAAGSPMPFHRETHEDMRNLHHRSHFTSSTPPETGLHHSPWYQPSEQWQRPDRSLRTRNLHAGAPSPDYDQPASNLYAFSTAAAKATGESTAPDSRIRNSYRTDTLTPVICAPGRYRKNGAAVSARTLSSGARQRSRGPPSRLMVEKMLMDGFPSKPIHRYVTGCRSSPPRPAGCPTSKSIGRKRGLKDIMPDFYISDDDPVASSGSSLRSGPSAEVVQVDDETRAAVRMSVLGHAMSGYTQGSAEGVRELSPNVNVWRKGFSGGSHHRKKRRPSYWDSDLQEIKMSPAGRGGIASSPPVSKRSMVAELETTSSKVSVFANEPDVENEFRGATPASGQSTEVHMTDAAELEA